MMSWGVKIFMEACLLLWLGLWLYVCLNDWCLFTCIITSNRTVRKRRSCAHKSTKSIFCWMCRQRGITTASSIYSLTKSSAYFMLFRFFCPYFNASHKLLLEPNHKLWCLIRSLKSSTTAAGILRWSCTDGRVVLWVISNQSLSYEDVLKKNCIFRAENSFQHWFIFNHYDQWIMPQIIFQILMKSKSWNVRGWNRKSFLFSKTVDWYSLDWLVSFD